MDSKNFALPLWRYKRAVDAKEVERRILFDALEWGLGDLPPVEELPDFWHDLNSGENIFHRVPRLRPIETFRLIPENPGELRSGAKSMSFFLFRPWERMCNDPMDLKNLGGSYRSKISFILRENSLILQKLHPLYKNCIEQFNIDHYIDLDNFIQKICKNYRILLNYIDKSDLFIYLVSYRNSEKNFINVDEIFKLYKKLTMAKILETLTHTEPANFPLKYICQHVEITWSKVPNGDAFVPTPPLSYLLEADTKRLRLPPLSAAQAHDQARGLWDAWWPEGQTPEKQWYVAAELAESCVARDPWQDVQRDGMVCIDFGTSSTVAAVREADNSVRLLRLDVSGAEGAPGEGPDPHENPTALEFANLEETLLPWRNEPWRPLVEWKHAKCSHLARNELRQGQRAESGLQAIKTWARALPGTCPVWLRDETGKDFTLSPLPVEEAPQGADPGDFATRPLDPIELYAYFLGIACNNQAFFGGRIYCDYTMTFPVKFPREVRQRILQGFRRGLLRSMPGSLTSSSRWQQEKHPFRLRERASEPTAFAASVLPWLGIVPTEGGVPFAVFDFGGGTSDFAFGLWRLPTPEERANEPWEQVLDILDVAGDENLGGEHLLELLAFELLRGNAENRAACVAAGITFTPPRNEALFDGSELLFTASREARANTVTLCELLRPLWEEGRLSDDGTGLLQANFLDREGATASIELKVNEDALRETLEQRILKGVRAFFAAFGQAFKAHGIRPQELHVLLAGNSCRSPLVQAAFETCLADIVPHERESVIIHDELLPGGARYASGAARVAADGSIAPTLKTGVALGLLRLLPGEATGMMERNRAEESPFLHTVGTFSNNVLQPVLPRNAEYGQWHVAGRIFREGVSLLGHTLAPEAIEQQCPRSACRQLRLEWGEENFGKYLFIRAVGPGRIEVALGAAADGAPDEESIRTLTLEG